MFTRQDLCYNRTSFTAFWPLSLSVHVLSPNVRQDFSYKGKAFLVYMVGICENNSNILRSCIEMFHKPSIFKF